VLRLPRRVQSAASAAASSASRRLQVATEAKPFASLSSGLLARKGAARPAMRPQGFGQIGNSLEDLGWDDMGFEPPKPVETGRDSTHDAFGDAVVEHPRGHPTGLTPIQSPVHDQQEQIAVRLAVEEVDEEADETVELAGPEFEAEPEIAQAAPAPVVQQVVAVKPVRAIAAVTEVPAPGPRNSPTPRTVAGTKGKAAFTLRLDPERHLKLRLACAVDGRSAQMLVTTALDQLLAAMPELEALAAKAKRKG
jgi:hypothetical protein